MARTLRELWRVQRDLTLIELMIVVVIVGVMAALGATKLATNPKPSRVEATAEELRSLSIAFLAHKAVHGEFPPDSRVNFPAGMEEFIDPGVWARETPIGGHYVWAGLDEHPYAGVSLSGGDSSPSTLDLLDELLDDGDLAAGRFRIAAGGHPTLIIQE